MRNINDHVNGDDDNDDNDDGDDDNDVDNDFDLNDENYSYDDSGPWRGRSGRKSRGGAPLGGGAAA